MMSTEEGLMIDNAFVILQVIRDGEHKLLATPLLLPANKANLFEKKKKNLKSLLATYASCY